jgi:maltose/moltooligosaccharide transporter
VFSSIYTPFSQPKKILQLILAFKLEKKESRFIPDLTESLKEMPATMKKLGLIQFFS